MQKDVVYVDVEDDITDIVARVKASDATIVALMPPKRLGAMQSTVNLKLLMRTAKKNKKNVVIVSDNRALVQLAAVAGVPVAKTLQSRPEVPEITALKIEDEGDVIVGEELPVGELAKSKDSDQYEVPVKHRAKMEKTGDDDVDVESIELEDEEGSKESKERPSRKTRVSNVPNFDLFRRNLFIIGALALMIGGILVWAIVFAPAATITVTAKTHRMNLSEDVTLVTEAAKVNVAEGRLLIEKFELEKTNEVEFEATGKKDVGEKAKGTMDLTRTDMFFWNVRVPAGTVFTSASGLEYVSTEDVTLNNRGGQYTATVAVEARAIGDEYNIAAQSFSVSVQNGSVDADGSEMAGGTRKTITVISDEDVNKAKAQLQDTTSEGKAELVNGFDASLMPIMSSLDVTPKDIETVPKVGEEVKGGKAKLVQKTIYSAHGVKRDQVKEFLDIKTADRIKNEANQRVYDDGLKDAFIDSYVASKDKAITGVLKTGSIEIGPEIDEAYIREVSKGKKYNEVLRKIESVNGVSDVDIKFSFFWVQKVPENDKKLTVVLGIGE